ncbi:MAG: DUF3501 family protein [Bacteroidia bacterium]|nr:DUF3501 family protein [Bacteroidia bacterium]
MQTLTVSDIQSNAEYEAVRAQVRKDICALRSLRRVELSDTFIVIFENRDTVRFQVQEMLRVERMDSPERIALELSCFNLLIPAEGELSATLMIRVPEYHSIEERLERMAGITRNALSLVVGHHEIPARFEIEDDIACESDVLYIRFHFTSEQRSLFCTPATPVQLRSIHPECHASVALEGELRNSLIGDLLQ